MPITREVALAEQAAWRTVVPIDSLLSATHMPMRRPLRYYVVKAKLGGIWPGAAISALIVLLALATWGWASGNITPSSVSVRGYYRSDGTYVRSHSRRPPGSRSHDAPYETVSLISLVVAIVGTVGAIRPTLRTIRALPEELLPPRSGVTDRLIPPDVPSREAISKKPWQCVRCQSSFRARTKYHFHEVRTRDGYRDRRKYCDSCSRMLFEEAPTRRATYRAYFKGVYGCEPDW
jgi:hypothetical protein